MLMAGAHSEDQKKAVKASARPSNRPAISAPIRFPIPPRTMMVNAFTVR